MVFFQMFFSAEATITMYVLRSMHHCLSESLSSFILLLSDLGALFDISMELKLTASMSCMLEVQVSTNAIETMLVADLGKSHEIVVGSVLETETQDACTDLTDSDPTVCAQRALAGYCAHEQYQKWCKRSCSGCSPVGYFTLLRNQLFDALTTHTDH